MLSLLAIFLSTLLLVLYVAWSRRSRYWADRGVVHEKPHPVYGSLTFLQKENPAIYMRNLYRKFRAPYVGIWLFWRPALVINSPEIARRVLVKDSDNFRNRLVGNGTAKTDPIGGLNLFTSNEPFWSSVRRRLTPSFTSAKLRALHNLQITKTKELVQRFGNEMEKKKDFELRNVFADFTTDIIGVAAFGVSCDATLTGASPIRKVTKDFMEYSFFRGWGWTCIFFLPEVVNFFRFKFFPNDTMAYFRKVYRSIETERGGPDGPTEQKDLMDVLLKMKHDALKNNEEMADDAMIAQAAVFLQGGFDTTAVSMSYITYELAFHPEYQDKLYEELVEAKKKLGGEDFDGTFLSTLPYLNSVVKETLRKYPAMGWLDRHAENDYQIDENLTILKGTTIYVNAIGMHYDPELYPEPEKFIPDRFAPENEKNLKPFSYLPFGDGPRSCIGMRFAYWTMWYAISAIFLKYKVVPKPYSKRPSDIELEKRAMFLMPGDEMFVDFIPRD